MVIKEIDSLVKAHDISKEHAEEIIDTYFTCYSDEWIYDDFLRDELRVIRKKEYSSIFDSLKSIDNIELIESDDYIIITNYQTLLTMNGGLDIFPEHSY